MYWFVTYTRRDTRPEATVYLCQTIVKDEHPIVYVKRLKDSHPNCSYVLTWYKELSNDEVRVLAEPCVTFYQVTEHYDSLLLIDG